MPKTIFLLMISIFAVVPYILAFDCATVSFQNQPQCLQIQSTVLNETVKNSILSNLDYLSKYNPDHVYVYNHNIGILVSNTPNNITKLESLFIKNAWLSNLTVMPSVLYRETLYVPDNTQLLNGYGYDIEIPGNYLSPGYPKGSDGDCRRDFSLEQNTPQNAVSVNGILQNYGKLVNLTILSNSTIKSDFSIYVAMGIDHYSWQQTECLEWDGDNCVKYLYECLFNYHETQTDSLEISD